MDDHHGVGDDVEHVSSGSQGTPGRVGSGRLGARVVGLAGAPVVLAWAWWVVSLPAFSASATVAVVGSGVVAMAAGASLRRRERPAVPGVVSPWAVVAAAAAAWQLAAYLQHPREDHPTLSSLANAVLDTHGARAAAFVLWLVGAAALARR